MMSWICALLQELACLFTRTLVRAVRMTKRRYRECAVIVSFGVVLAVMVFCAGNFSGGVRTGFMQYRVRFRKRKRERILLRK